MSKPLIRVDREGRWYYGDREIIRKEIVRELFGLLDRDPQGRYWLRMGDEQQPLEVEDTVFLVEEVQREGEGFVVRLNDGTKEQLDLETFWMTPEGVPYCMVKGGRFPARFTRIAFYQLGQHASFDGLTYFIEVAGRRYILDRSEGSTPRENR